MVGKMKGFVYWHPVIYSTFVKYYYGPSYHQRYTRVVDFIDSGSSVADLCCGDAKVVDYLRGNPPSPKNRRR